LAEAPGAPNKPEQPWEVTVEGDSIIAHQKWMDASFFSPNEVCDETRALTFTIALNNKGKWQPMVST